MALVQSLAWKLLHAIGADKNQKTATPLPPVLGMKIWLLGRGLLAMRRSGMGRAQSWLWWEALCSDLTDEWKCYQTRLSWSVHAGWERRQGKKREEFAEQGEVERE